MKSNQSRLERFWLDSMAAQSLWCTTKLSKDAPNFAWYRIKLEFESSDCDQRRSCHFSLSIPLPLCLFFALVRLNEYDENLHEQRWFLFWCSWSYNDFGQFICRLVWFPCLRLRRNSSLRLFLEVICRLNFFTFNRARHRDIIKSSISCCACYKFECPRVNGNLLYILLFMSVCLHTHTHIISAVANESDKASACKSTNVREICAFYTDISLIIK